MKRGSDSFALGSYVSPCCGAPVATGTGNYQDTYCTKCDTFCEPARLIEPTGSRDE